MATQTSAQTVLGGWSNWTFSPSAEAVKVFKESLGKLVGIKYYDLVACRTQIVEGTNYRFICAAEAASIWPEAVYLIEAEVYQPLKGNPVIVKINEIGTVPRYEPGGWQNWRFPASEQAVNALKKATLQLAGAGYKAFGSSAQIVAGTRYCLICEQTIIVPNAPVNAVLVYLYQSLDGNVHISNIVPAV